MEKRILDLTTPSYAAPAAARVEPQRAAEYVDLSQLPETYTEIQLVTNVLAFTSDERETFEDARSQPGVGELEVAAETGGIRTEARLIPTYVNYKSQN